MPVADDVGMLIHSESQVVLPDAFLALYLTPTARPAVPLPYIQDRHEFCEDLAQSLVAHATEAKCALSVTEEDVLQRIHAGLRAATSGVSEAEAQWVTRRLAEVMAWPQPTLV